MGEGEGVGLLPAQAQGSLHTMQRIHLVFEIYGYKTWCRWSSLSLRGDCRSVGTPDSFHSKARLQGLKALLLI